MGVAVNPAGNVIITDYWLYIYQLDYTSSSRGTLTRIAGGALGGDRGDGGPADDLNVGLNNPTAVTFDDNGSIYFVDTGNNRVRRLSFDGQQWKISAFAGVRLGGTGYSGDGGPATAAKFDISSTYAGIAADPMGNVYIIDYGNNVVRKVSPSGIISTVAGTGLSGYSGDGGQATAAALDPRGIAVDGQGNLYIAAGLRVRKVDPSGKITTIAGNGTQGFGGDGGPASAALLS